MSFPIAANMEMRAYRQRFTSSTKHRFDQRHRYDEGNVIHPRFARIVVDQADLQKGWKVLDLACGTGYATYFAAEHVGKHGRVLGIDISSGMLRQAEEKLMETDSCNVSFQLANVDTIEFDAMSFNAILAASAVPYLSDTQAAFEKLHSWLIKPDGVLSYNCPEANYSRLITLLCQLLQERGKTEWKSPMESLPDMHAHEKMLLAAGFSEVKVVKTCNPEDGLMYESKDYPEAAWKFVQGFDAFFQLNTILNPKEIEALKVDFQTRATVIGNEMADCTGVIRDAFAYLWVIAKC